LTHLMSNIFLHNIKNGGSMKFVITLVLLSCALFLMGEEVDNLANYLENQSYENFVKAVDQFKNNGDYSANAMISYLHLMELHRNFDILETNIDSLNVRTKFMFGNMLLEIGEYEKSVMVYAKINEDSPSWSCPLRHKGEALMAMDLYADAEIATKKAIELQENHFDAYIQLAEIQKKMGNYEIALKTLEKGLTYAEFDHEDEVSDEEVEVLKNEILELINQK